MQFVLLIEYCQDDDEIYDNIEVLEASIMDNSNGLLQITPIPTEAALCSQSENLIGIPITNVKKKK